MSDPTTEATEPLPWTAKMLAETHFTRVGSRGRYYDPAEVDPFVKRAAGEVARLTKDNGILRTDNSALQQAKATRHDPRRPPVMAIDAMVRASDQGEADLALAQKEYADTRRRTATMVEEAEAVRREAESYLRAAKAVADTPVAAAPELRELPPEPQPTGDMAGDIAARSEHLQECRRLLDQWHAEDEARLAEQRQFDDERREALGEKLDRFVEALDQLATALPDVRAQVIDLTGETPAVPEQVAS